MRRHGAAPRRRDQACPATGLEKARQEIAVRNTARIPPAILRLMAQQQVPGVPPGAPRPGNIQMPPVPMPTMPPPPPAPARKPPPPRPAAKSDSPPPKKRPPKPVSRGSTSTSGYPYKKQPHKSKAVPSGGPKTPAKNKTASQY